MNQTITERFTGGCTPPSGLVYSLHLIKNHIVDEMHHIVDEILCAYYQNKKIRVQ